MKHLSARSIAFVASLCVGAATLAIMNGVSSKPARAAEPPPIELKQPACACTSSSLSAGRTMHNCQCGGLQCIVVDSSYAAATPGLYCTK